jgi:hypothetical protein
MSTTPPPVTLPLGFAPWQLNALAWPAPIPHTQQGAWLALLGHLFLREVELETPEQCAHWGLATVWFGRYVAQGVALPYPPPHGEVKVFEKAQLRLKGETLTGQPLTPQQTEVLLAHLTRKLGLDSPPAVVKFEWAAECCHAPCFGCTRTTQTHPVLK